MWISLSYYLIHSMTSNNFLILIYLRDVRNRSSRKINEKTIFHIFAYLMMPFYSFHVSVINWLGHKLFFHRRIYRYFSYYKTMLRQPGIYSFLDDLLFCISICGIFSFTWNFKTFQECLAAFLPGEFHGQRRLAWCSPWSCRVGHNWATNSIHYLCKVGSVANIL